MDNTHFLFEPTPTGAKLNVDGKSVVVKWLSKDLHRTDYNVQDEAVRSLTGADATREIPVKVKLVLDGPSQGYATVRRLKRSTLVLSYGSSLDMKVEIATDRMISVDRPEFVDSTKRPRAESEPAHHLGTNAKRLSV